MAKKRGKNHKDDIDEEALEIEEIWARIMAKASANVGYDIEKELAKKPEKKISKTKDMKHTVHASQQ